MSFQTIKFKVFLTVIDAICEPYVHVIKYY
jgi:hypothetical protein